MKIGVLALQGDFREHIDSVLSCGVEAFALNRVEQLTEMSGLIIPGGESTTISKLAKSFELFEPIKRAIAAGLPTYGSCAGMIMLADSILEPASGQESFGGLDITVRRNAFGSQVESFESDIEFQGVGNVRAIFIRAPWVEKAGEKAKVLAQVERQGSLHPVAVSQGRILATSFHPEISGDTRIHSYFLENYCQK